MLTQCRLAAETSAAAFTQHQADIVPTYRVYWIDLVLCCLDQTGMTCVWQICHSTADQWRVYSTGRRIVERQTWNSFHGDDRQTRYVDPMLFQCWPIVFDDGPSLKQHWFNVKWGVVSLPNRDRRWEGWPEVVASNFDRSVNSIKAWYIKAWYRLYHALIYHAFIELEEW